MYKPFTVLAFLAALAFALPASAQGHGHGPPDKGGGPPGKGQGQGQGQGQARGQGQGHGQGQGQGNVVIADHDRNAVYNYYRTEYVAGNCPPGLAKKDNGCLPPGQAKKLWAVGQPLPADVIYYPLPGVLLGQLSAPPVGYEYVRVANDILLMAVGSRMIAGALADLSSF
jgi:hypothetical protein